MPLVKGGGLSKDLYDGGGLSYCLLSSGFTITGGAWEFSTGVSLLKETKFTVILALRPFILIEVKSLTYQNAVVYFQMADMAMPL